MRIILKWSDGQASVHRVLKSISTSEEIMTVSVDDAFREFIERNAALKTPRKWVQVILNQPYSDTRAHLDSDSISIDSGHLKVLKGDLVLHVYAPGTWVSATVVED